MPPITVTTKASARTSEPISGLTLRMGAGEHAAERRQPDAEPEDQQPDLADIDAKHAHDLRIASAGPNDQAEPGLLRPSQSSSRMTATTPMTKSR